jgi:Uma2 family endonuclease
MPDPAPRERPLTVDEYLREEERAVVRHEYVAGATYAMTGTTARHNTIALNVYRRLHAAAADGPCRAFVSDVKVRAASDVFYYPDVVVTCAPVGDTDVYLREPCLVVEVTSPSTATIDRREKLLAYRQIPAVRAYLVVDQARRHVEVHARDGAVGEWTHATVAGDGVVAVPCPPTTLALDAIYEGVALPALGEPEPAAYPA